MPAVTPAERHNPQRYGSSLATQPARMRAPPQAAPSFPSPCSPCSPWFVFSVSSVFSVVCFFRALHVVSDVGPAFQPAWAPLTQCLSCNRSLLRPLQHAALLATPAILVEQAARLAMPAVTPAERHNPQRYGSSHATQPARMRAPPQAAPSFPSPCSPCSPWFVFSVSSVFSVLLARRFFSAREDFLCRHTCLVAALPRCGLLFPCPPCRVRCGAGFPACGRLSSRPWPP